MDDIRCAEQALVATIALYPERLAEVAGWLGGSDFATPVCGLIFDRLVELEAEGRVDAQRLLESFRERGELRSDGYPIAALTRWFDDVPPRPALPAYGALVLEGALARQLEAAGIRLVQVAGRGAPARALLAAATQRTMLTTARRRWCALPHQPQPAPAPQPEHVNSGATGSTRRARGADPAELVVVGSLMCAPQLAGRLAGWLQPADFGDRRLAAAYSSAVAMTAAGAPLDRITLTAELRRAAPQNMRDVAELLRQAEAAVPVVASAPFYARQVLDAAVVRAVDSTGEQLVRLGRERRGGALAMLDSAIGELDGLAPMARRLRRSRVSGVPSRQPARTAERSMSRAAAPVAERAGR